MDINPFGTVLDNKWKQILMPAVDRGVALALDDYPFILNDQELMHLQLIGKGLGSNVYAFDNQWVIKIAADRHPDVISPNYSSRQMESYIFLRDHLGINFIVPSIIFSCPIWGRQRGCEVQPYIHGRQLKSISNAEIKSNPLLQKKLLQIVTLIISTYHSTGRIPDLWDVGFQKSARYTKNIIVGQDLNPWIVDIGAWPEGFSTHSGIRASIHVQKIISDLCKLEHWLEKLQH